jgi:hypothetical protein
VSFNNECHFPRARGNNRPLEAGVSLNWPRGERDYSTTNSRGWSCFVLAARDLNTGTSCRACDITLRLGIVRYNTRSSGRQSAQEHWPAASQLGISKISSRSQALLHLARWEGHTYYNFCPHQWRLEAVGGPRYCTNSLGQLSALHGTSTTCRQLGSSSESLQPQQEYPRRWNNLQLYGKSVEVARAATACRQRRSWKIEPSWAAVGRAFRAINICLVMLMFTYCGALQR